MGDLGILGSWDVRVLGDLGCQKGFIALSSALPLPPRCRSGQVMFKMTKVALIQLVCSVITQLIEALHGTVERFAG